MEEDFTVGFREIQRGWYILKGWAILSYIVHLIIEESS